MKNKLYLLAFALLPTLGFSQYHWEVGGSLGASNYLGDIGGLEQTRRDFVADLKFSQTHFAINGFGRYKVHPNISLGAFLTYGRISGKDKLSTNPGRVGRNLNFRNDLWELTVDGQFFFYEVNDIGRAYRYRNDFRAFVFAGVGGLFHNPKGQLNGEGDWIKLQPLTTEGVHYSRLQFVIPSGVGFYFTVSKQHRIGWELGWRKTFTDYLDDISTVYADPKTLPNQQSVDMANQSHFVLTNSSEPSLQNYGPPSNLTNGKRGDPTHNDSYMFTMVSYSYVIKGKSKFSKARYKSYFRKGKYKKRKIRAKF
jgi:hypothetical protein